MRKILRGEHEAVKIDARNFGSGPVPSKWPTTEISTLLLLLFIQKVIQQTAQALLLLLSLLLLCLGAVLRASE